MIKQTLIHYITIYSQIIFLIMISSFNLNYYVDLFLFRMNDTLLFFYLKR